MPPREQRPTLGPVSTGGIRGKRAMELSGSSGQPSEQSLYSVARELLAQGLPVEEVYLRLIDEGFSERSVELVLRRLASATPAAPGDGEGEGRGVFSAFVKYSLLFGGGTLAALGMVLLVGNVTGVLPTFSFAGFLLMGLGGWLVERGIRL